MTASLAVVQIVCLVVIVCATVVLVWFERRWPHRSGQRFLRPSFFDDLVVYSLLQSYGVGVLVAWWMGALNRHLPATRGQLLAHVPVAAQIALFLVTHDFLLYWFHRAQHASVWLWWTHALHHTNRQLDWVAGSRATALEMMITESMKYLPIVLLGAAPQVAVIKGTIDAVWGIYLHTNLDVRAGRLKYVLNGPELHRWHHALDRDAWGKNLATKFALWDWLFGTAFLPERRVPVGYGLQQGDMPRGYLHQQLFAFQRARAGAAGAAVQEAPRRAPELSAENMP